MAAIVLLELAPVDSVLVGIMIIVLVDVGRLLRVRIATVVLVGVAALIGSLVEVTILSNFGSSGGGGILLLALPDPLVDVLRALHFDLVKVRASRFAFLPSDGLWDVLSNDLAISRFIPYKLSSAKQKINL